MCFRCKSIAALAAVQGARALLEISGQRYLLTRAVGAVIPALEQATSVIKTFAIAPAFRAIVPAGVMSRGFMRATSEDGLLPSESMGT